MLKVTGTNEAMVRPNLTNNFLNSIRNPTPDDRTNNNFTKKEGKAVQTSKEEGLLVDSEF